MAIGARADSGDPAPRGAHNKSRDRRERLPLSWKFQHVSSSRSPVFDFGAFGLLQSGFAHSLEYTPADRLQPELQHCSMAGNQGGIFSFFGFGQPEEERALTPAAEPPAAELPQQMALPAVAMLPPPAGVKGSDAAKQELVGQMLMAQTTSAPTAAMQQAQQRSFRRGDKRRSDPKEIFHGLKGLSVLAALDQTAQLRGLLKKEDKPPAVNAYDKDGDRMPLHWAAARGHLKCVQLLLEAGAKTGTREDGTQDLRPAWQAIDSGGKTPADLALACGEIEAYQLLLYGLAKDDPKRMHEKQGYLSLFSALGQPKQVAELLESKRTRRRPDAKLFAPGDRIIVGFAPDERDADGDRYPLHWAAARGHTECVQLLIDGGASLGVCDAEGFTAAALAARLNQRGTQVLLHKALGTKTEDTATEATQYV